VVAKVTTALTALGRADEAAALYDEACAATADPSIHLHAAYWRAMLYTRFYEGPRRNHAKAKGWINTAIALASQMPPSRARAFNLTFQENGLALIEMHLGDGARALQLVTDGLRRLDEEMEPGKQSLQRSVLRYNRAQLLARIGPPEAALREYSEAIEVDPHHSEYHFERAAVQRALGRTAAALEDYNVAIRLSPPYPEAYYNRGELLLELGEVDAALADFSYVLELDPRFLDAYVNRASASWHEDDLVQAHDGFSAALAADPALVAAWSNRAVLYFEQGDLDAAIECLTRAIAIADDPTLRENRAQAREQAGRLEEATADRDAVRTA
jgi:tetratricopeptide (TPR) repeat protein